MTIQVRCRCGQVGGRMVPERAYARATCYCRDCQAYARFIGQPGTMDAAGGTDIVAMAPDGLHIDHGHDQVACMSLGPRGLLRWYAACCRTPLANTGRDAGMYYTGLVTTCLAAPDAELDARLGPRDRIAINPASARAPVDATPWRLLTSGARIFTGIVVAQLRTRRAGAPFFDPQGRPVATPEVIGHEHRAALERD